MGGWGMKLWNKMRAKVSLIYLHLFLVALRW